MKKRVFGLLSLSIIMSIGTVSCSSDSDSSSDNLSEFQLKTYNPVSESLKDKSILLNDINKNLDGTTNNNNFDNSQAWFQLAGNKLNVSSNTTWSLGFWNGTGSRVILNYTVKTQAVEITGYNSITDILNRGQVAIDNALNNYINGGVMGFGDLNTFDFHSENQFVIGDPGNNGKFYLIKQPNVQLHPDVDDPDAPSSSVEASEFLIHVKTTTNGYTLTSQALKDNELGNKIALGSEINIPNIAKDNSYQYNFVAFNSADLVKVQPKSSDWELALSAVIKKNYMSNGDAYAFVTKGFVLNNNKDVSVYKVQSTASNAGAPGSYDPNFNWQNDPALDPSNSIDAQFTSFDYSQIDDSKFSSDTQEEIGQYWRNLNMGQYRIFVDRFYVVKLKNGDVYKLKFVNPQGGNSINNGIKFQYQKIAKQS